MFLFVFFLVAFVASAALTCLLRLYAIRNNVLDIPVNRSSHTIPTPRGGGVAIVITLIVLLFGTYLLGLISVNMMLALIVPGFIIAVIGFLDDHGHIDAKLRLSFHFISAGLGLYFLGGFPDINILGFNIQVPVIGIIFGLLFLVWMLNLYNFMDGINGIAGVEAVTFSVLSFVIIYFTEPTLLDNGLSVLLMVLGGASLGFLIWNFPVAKIFMGDAGSGFLGITIGLTVLLITRENSTLFLSEIILLGIFIVDATITLIRRVGRKQKPFEAHSSHCYQIVARHFQSHARTTTAVLAINLLWLAPLAFLAANSYLDGTMALLIAWAPLIFIAWRCGAGVKDRDQV